MPFILSNQNVWDYLSDRHLLNGIAPSQGHVELKVAKNFNLLVQPNDGFPLLVKQERFNQSGQTLGEFNRAWSILNALKTSPSTRHSRSYLPQILDFDQTTSILVSAYLADYQDGAEVSSQTHQFPVEVAQSIGRAIAILHRETYQNIELKVICKQHGSMAEQWLGSVSHLNRISPEIFGQVPSEGIKFFMLYQRYDSLGDAIAQLHASSHRCCLTHNDLKLNNILIHQQWDATPQPSNMIRLIDWERADWGDPAQDLGSMIASYLQCWLGSLVVSPAIALEESLRMAMIPFEAVQPAIASLVQAYCGEFPGRRQDRTFLTRIIQHSGLALIQQILASIQYQKIFNNTGICMLQVAKSLLCRPQEYQETLLGHAIVQEL